ncbi:Ldh family oxidoreductase [Bosea lathyri]|uniref:Malate/lactate/ureidoglycolate dehydrogenase, LDH2 family n=1 Tax=Bosea lathyri TaxID=1036778 RepID=A0A1H6C9D5_9HYPH|nr:Ldh family oxidoreductase [Bosea lathyri]SEG69518.1 Malate/lactate/ureidoglycolate dehydrogenase, LDH2 family [Bosea lathyri]
MRSANKTGDEVRVSVVEAAELAAQALQGAGFPEGQARTLALHFAAVEADGCSSHGLKRILRCIETARTHPETLEASPVASYPSPAVVMVDAHSGFSPCALAVGLPLLLEVASTLGIAALAVRNCFHVSALWPDVEWLADRTLVALSMTTSHPWVRPFGASRRLFGTNPIAFGWPRDNRKPFVFDFATSAISRGGLEALIATGSQLPADVAVDTQGRATVDPKRAAEGDLLTFGGHKGAALATMIELLAGPLVGDYLSQESGAVARAGGAAPQHGQFLIAIGAERFGTTYKDRAETLFGWLEDEDLRLPSHQRYARRAESDRNGFSIPATLYGELKKLGGTFER